ncbi:SLBB domain-containing protein [Argonema galeatum]|uniref:SLBB domain-containing protein n=1 Tax=Argonema galeatum TaxID=2942762 RepID=UPI00201356AF|nr:SLBB domain-containing protein [Argonema galeatum]MCL1467685.1 SLBB domain-containing protein [Argonema galeatum A003/A1]
MVYSDFSRQITPSFAGLVLLSLTLVASPTPSLALQLAQLQSAPRQQNSSFVESQTAAYTLGGGDRIRIDILEVPQYSGEYQLLVDGSINMPLVGKISLFGLTLEQASEAISAKYASILKYPAITVNLVEPRPVTILVSGEVERPGTYTVSVREPSSPNVRFPTVTQAIQLAGGMNLSADLANVQLRRKKRSGSPEVIKLDLTELLQAGASNQDIKIRDGDTIFVPTQSNFNQVQASQIAASNFGVDPIRPLTVAIAGEVARPGTYIIAERGGVNTNADRSAAILPSLTRAIQQAGGITSAADIRQIQVRRLTRAGAQQIINVNLWNLLQTGDISQELVLQDRDTIFVPTATDVNPTEAAQIATATFSPATIRINVVGEVPKPGVVEVPPNTPLNQALLAAGGFDRRRARQSSVELIRLNQNGTVSRRTVVVDFAESINEVNNPLLRNNDAIVVSRSGMTRVLDTIDSLLRPVNNISVLLRLLGLF